MDHRRLLIVLFCGLILPSCDLREYHYINMAVTWAEAQRYCRVKHYDLATIESQEEVSQLKLIRPELDRRVAWIGLTDFPSSWKGIMHNDSNSWRWSATGETNSGGFQSWYTGQPDNSGGREKCVFVGKDGNWHDDNCIKRYYFICYNNATTLSDQKTYKEYANIMTWESARDYCRQHHTDLAMIESAEDHAAMASIRIGQIAWVGLYRLPWSWSDGSSSTFRNWKSSQPNNYGNQYCAYEDETNQWADDNCSKKFAVLCQGAPKKKTFMVTMKILTVADLSNPATNNLILQQLTAALTDKKLTDLELRWRIQPRKR